MDSSDVASLSDALAPDHGEVPGDRAKPAIASPLWLLARLDRVGAVRFSAVAILAYLGLGLAAYFPGWPGDPHLLTGGCACGDVVQQSWFLGWVPWAIAHGHNIFFTTRMYYPSGANLAINTEMPLLGLVTAPVSLLVSPVASFNLLMYLAYPLSATSMYFVVRHWTRSNIASAIGGVLYGFSAYVVGEGLGHLNLSFVPFPPLIFLALHEVLVAQRGSARRWGIALGLLAAGQFLISPEILSTTGIVAAIGLVILAVVRRGTLDRRRLDHALIALVPAVAIFVVLCSYPIYMLVAGPERYHGAVQAINNPFRADLLGPVVPNSDQRVAPSAAVSLGDRFAMYPAENGSYIGIPLVLLALWCTIRFRRDRWVVAAGAFAVIGYVLSLGPTLMVAGHSTGIPLPFDVIVRLPLLENILPSRISLYEVMFVAVLVSLGVADALAGAPATRAAPPIVPTDAAARAAPPIPPAAAATARSRRVAVGTMVAVLSVATVISLIPSWPDQMTDVSTADPPFFTSSVVDQIPYDGVVLTYPFAVSPDNQAMLWQEDDRYRFTILGGYALEPQPNGSVSPWPPELAPLDVQEFLGWEEFAPSQGYLLPAAPPVTGQLIRDFRVYAKRYAVGTVLFDPVGDDPRIVLDVLTRAFGPPSATEGGLDLWFHVDTELAARVG